ncbi:MAG: cold shock domain-containing protein [Dehalococcoidales bacterium]|nr:cold shock domain-containing protein [Dehalococcoidales bacterium]
MSDRVTVRRHGRNHDMVFPPTAEEIATCPPHYWIIEKGSQWCRKCGERRQIDGQRTGPIAGTVSRIITERGVGYLKDSTGREYFFNRSGVRENGFTDLEVGQKVEFDPGFGSQMGGRAMNIRLVSEEVKVG